MLFEPLFQDHCNLGSERPMLRLRYTLECPYDSDRDFHVNGFQFLSHMTILNSSGRLSREMREPPQPTLEDRVFCGGLAQHEADLFAC